MTGLLFGLITGFVRLALRLTWRLGRALTVGLWALSQRLLERWRERRALGALARRDSAVTLVAPAPSRWAPAVGSRPAGRIPATRPASTPAARRAPSVAPAPRATRPPVANPPAASAKPLTGSTLGSRFRTLDSR